MSPAISHYLTRLAALECNLSSEALRVEVKALYEALSPADRAMVPADGRSRWRYRDEMLRAGPRTVFEKVRPLCLR